MPAPDAWAATKGKPGGGRVPPVGWAQAVARPPLQSAAWIPRPRRVHLPGQRGRAHVLATRRRRVRS
jgi:hypothetical protein